MAEKLKGKIAFVTGSARGLGAEVCKSFAEEGVTRIALADILENELFETSKQIERKYDIKTVPIVMDVSLEMDWISACNIVKKEFGSVNILVNNAGISHRVGFADCTIEDWSKVIAVNQTGTFLGMKHIAPLMKVCQGGSIINVSSIAGLTGYFAAAYTASKWAVRGMTKAAAMEFGEWDIRVNSVHPGFVWTPLTYPAKELTERFSEITALNRVGSADEIAKSIVFLASDDSSFVTGAELAIDAGLTAGGGVRKIAQSLNLIK
ncbi:SDR family NAD(P)-dependent oxidoreductase [Neobacillus vireti]|uniref:Short-chain dehydrogenase/reductase SDR n=1 Tax=Neobacillus vireti LMG 21834 TaxID=1131730 RepID=A0AB94IPJ5_9BACI|nr:SDR family oxidoreductase [Neobacillus vireti]ETI69005.1 short-chain dehydrogenase/reductase SDR [Neobacillus vireti LMG 21834]KLT15705.1 short-chain dehydrogenase [Neobacillus vireti]